MITHDPSRQKLFVMIEGSEAQLTYRKEGQHLVFDHTYVPNDLRGRGLAKSLVEYGISYARKHHFKVRPVCPYVVKYFNKYSDEIKDLLIE